MVLIVLVLVLAHQTCNAVDSQEYCPPSSCGNIRNISYPFRLEGDPEDCGVPEYNLSCQNNQTVLKLYDGIFYVREINYDNYTIRIVDPGIIINTSTDSFMPPDNSLDESNFSPGDPYTPSFPTTYVPCYWCETRYSTCIRNFPDQDKNMVFVKCEKQVNSPFYLDISTCFKNGYFSSNSSLLQYSKRYIYVIVEERSVLAGDLGESCEIDHKTLEATSWEPVWPNNSVRDFRCPDFYDAMLSGFTLSWFQATCDSFIDGECYINDDMKYPGVQCHRPRPGE
ncbi:hypothetical protein FH972_007091 [Carpinus fangiana]|uniref:Wall-associated receptor kinase galacturonan-binding domain-containing protein n=1 Tax=Carpinus fangiana TaxID=176857 RepID=A0A5N6QUK5_9ROSI|nr:hypothetical protein FH972_007091 [Carpinus fangiana]